MASTSFSAQLVLNEALFDPASVGLAGDANRDGTRSSDNDEFLELINSGNTPLDISGYKIYDATRFDDIANTDDPRHVIGDTDNDDVADVSVILPAGGIYVVFGGGDLTTIKAALPNVIFETCSSLGLTNSGEILTITDASSNVVISFNDDEIPYADGRTEGDPAMPETFGLEAGANQSLTRYPAVTGDFGYHLGLNGQYQSPGELPTLPTGGDLIINEIFVRPGTNTGDANGDGTGGVENEFLEIINTTNQAIDISGYKFFDRTNLFLDGVSAAFSGTPRHVVPASTVIPAGEAYVVFSGGTLTADFGIATVHTASSGLLSLTDAGDFMVISDANDNYVTGFGSNSVVDTWNDFRSYTRSPDITGNFVKHDAIDGVTARFSPGKKIDGTNFSAALSVGNFLGKNIKVYVANNNTLRIEGNLEGQNNLKIYNILGRKVFQKTFNIKNTNSFNLSEMAKGVYLININNSLYGNLNKKILIK
ncbi:hypothetical protein BTO18_11240 [Polaribacter porphyrae]|uniref:LTD domain-containing protein n=2 Tax=Polaribacter porphyrae TaxID=1137780 RepID=A0A2S7WQ20_9FLAO|nr:hypothetical protein BTO18_11240 [Polaribacter porphyrae]